MPCILMVAEKPALADTISGILSKKSCKSSQSGATAVFEWTGPFQGQPGYTFRMTSVKGHVLSTDFPARFQSWDKTDPRDLFDAPVERKECSGGMCRHLQTVAKGCDQLVLWLDCDREGENICFE